MWFVCRITKARGRTRTLTTFNTYTFTAATVVTRTSFGVTLCVHCLSCLAGVCIAAVLVADNIAVEWWNNCWIMCWKGFGRKRSWISLIFCPSTCVECCEVHWPFSETGCGPITIRICHLSVKVTALQLEPSLPVVLLSSERKATF
jgi:hypothetical protein